MFGPYNPRHHLGDALDASLAFDLGRVFAKICSLGVNKLKKTEEERTKLVSVQV
jgi:hypothetical protein